MNPQPPHPPVARDLAAFTGRGYDEGAGLLKRLLWVLLGQPIQASVVCPPGIRIRILRLFGARIGRGVLIRHDVRIHWPWKLSIGEHSWIGVAAWLLNLEPITIGSNVCISQQALLCTGGHKSDDPSFEFDNGPICIEDGVWIAARATVLRGVRVGRGSIVGACALAARDVAPFSTLLAPAPTIR